MKRILGISAASASDYWRSSLGNYPGISLQEVSWEKCTTLWKEAGQYALILAAAADAELEAANFFRQLRVRPLSCSVLALLPSGASPELLIASQTATDVAMLPLSPDAVRARVEELLGAALNQAAEATRKLTAELCLRDFVTQDTKFLRVLDDIRKMARANAPVLIVGETGTGKELCARALHHLSARSADPFIPVDCPAVPDYLFENELFGHVRGAFTDAHAEQKGLVGLARGGTLFLDEVDSLSVAAQGKLLRFLQDRIYRPLGSEHFLPSDVTVLAASNRDLRECLDSHQFRSDLYFRLNVLRIELSPLRDRPGDIELLARHFIRKFTPRGTSAAALGAGVVETLRAHDWRGNVRELSNVMQRATVLAEGGRILPEHLYLSPAAERRQSGAPGVAFREARTRAIEDFERRFIGELLEQHQGNVTQAARAAGQERRAFGRMVKKYGMNRPAAAPRMQSTGR